MNTYDDSMMNTNEEEEEEEKKEMSVDLKKYTFGEGNDDGDSESLDESSQPQAWLSSLNNLRGALVRQVSQGRNTIRRLSLQLAGSHTSASGGVSGTFSVNGEHTTESSREKIVKSAVKNSLEKLKKSTLKVRPMESASVSSASSLTSSPTVTTSSEDEIFDQDMKKDNVVDFDTIQGCESRRKSGIKVDIPKEKGTPRMTKSHKKKKDTKKIGVPFFTKRNYILESMYQILFCRKHRSLGRVVPAPAVPGKGILVKRTHESEKNKRKAFDHGQKKQVRFDLKLHTLDETKIEWHEKSWSINTRFATIWSGIRIGLYTYTIFRFPFRLSFGSNDDVFSREYFLSDFAPDVFFTLDIIFLHFFEYIDEDRGNIYQRDLRCIRLNYWSFWSNLRKILRYARQNIWLDLAAIVPYHLSAIILYIFATNIQYHELILQIVCIPRLQRILKLFNWFKRMEFDIYSDYQMIALFKFCLMLIGAAHWVGCLWFLLARLRNFKPSTWIAQYDQLILHPDTYANTNSSRSIYYYDKTKHKWRNYQISIFYGFYSMTAFGYPTTPDNDTECMYIIILCIAQLVYNAYILGTLFHYVVKNDSSMENFRKRMNGIEAYAEARKLPTELVTRMKRYMYFVASRVDTNQDYILTQMPPSLVQKIARWQHLKLIKTTTIFNGVPEQYLTMLLVKLRSRYLEPGEILFKLSDMSKELCFIQSGTLDEFEDSACRRQIRSISSGIIGELAFFVGIVQPSVVAASHGSDVVLQSITKEEYEEITDAYSEGHSITLSNIMAQLGLSTSKDYNTTLDATIQNCVTSTSHGTHSRRKTDQFKSSSNTGENVYREKVNAQIAITLKRQKDDELSAMIDAASEGDVETIRKIIHKGFDINTGDYDARTMLHLASAEGNLRVVKVLLDEGADVSVVDRWQNQPLHDAVRGDHQQVAQLLAAHGATLTYDDPASILCSLVTNEDFDGLKNNIQYGTPVNSADYDGRTALHLAASDGNHNFIAWLLQSKVDVNVTDRWGNTPLVDAVRNLHELPAKILFEAGGEMHHGHASSLLCDAALKGNRVFLKLLHECGTDVRSYDYDRRTALHLASAEGQLVSVDFLLSAKAQIHFKDRWGGTAIDDAIRGGHYEVARLLQASGAKARAPLTNEQEDAISKVDLELVRENIRKKVHAQESARRKRQQIRDCIKLCARDLASTKDHMNRSIDALIRSTQSIIRKAGSEMLVMSLQHENSVSPKNNTVGDTSNNTITADDTLKYIFQVPYVSYQHDHLVHQPHSANSKVHDPLHCNNGQEIIYGKDRSSIRSSLNEQILNRTSLCTNDVDKEALEDKVYSNFAMRRFLKLPDLPPSSEELPILSLHLDEFSIHDFSLRQSNTTNTLTLLNQSPTESKAKQSSPLIDSSPESPNKYEERKSLPASLTTKDEKKRKFGNDALMKESLAAVLSSDGDEKFEVSNDATTRIAENCTSLSSTGNAGATKMKKNKRSTQILNTLKVALSVVTEAAVVGDKETDDALFSDKEFLSMDEYSIESKSDDEEEAKRLMHVARNTMKNSGRREKDTRASSMAELGKKTKYKFNNFNQIILLFPEVERGFAMFYAKFNDSVSRNQRRRMKQKVREQRQRLQQKRKSSIVTNVDNSLDDDDDDDDAVADDFKEQNKSMTKDQMFRFLRELNILVSMRLLTTMYTIEINPQDSQPIETDSLNFIQLVSSSTFVELLDRAAADIIRIQNDSTLGRINEDSVSIVNSLRRNYQIVDAAFEMLDRTGRGQLSIHNIKSAIGADLRYGNELINLFSGLQVITRVDFLICLLKWLTIIDDDDTLFTADDDADVLAQRQAKILKSSVKHALTTATPAPAAQTQTTTPIMYGMQAVHPDAFYSLMKTNYPYLAKKMKRLPQNLVAAYANKRAGNAIYTSTLDEFFFAIAASMTLAHILFRDTYQQPHHHHHHQQQQQAQNHASTTNNSSSSYMKIVVFFKIFFSELYLSIAYWIHLWKIGCASMEEWLIVSCSYENVEYIFHDLDRDYSGTLDFREFEIFIDRVSDRIRLPRYKIYQLYYCLKQDSASIDFDTFKGFWHSSLNVNSLQKNRAYDKKSRKDKYAVESAAASVWPSQQQQQASSESLSLSYTLYTLFPKEAFILPDSYTDRFFIHLNVILGIYYALSVPYHIAHYHETLELIGAVFLPMYIADLLLWVCILRKFCTAYMNRRSVIEKNFLKCRKHYFKNEFSYDFFTALPFDLFVFASSGRRGIAVIIRIIRFIRLRDVYKYLINKRQSLGRIQSELYILFTSLATVLHVLACTWTIITTNNTKSKFYQSAINPHWDGYGSELRGRGRLQIDQYIFSLYWVSAGLTGVGTGMLQPSTHAERWFGVVMMLVNLSLLAYLLGTISSLFMSADERVVTMRSEIAAANTFIEERQLPPNLEMEVRSCSYFQANSMATSSDFDENDIFRSLSYTLQVDVAKYISRGLLVNSLCFQSCSDNFIDTLSTMLTETTHSPGTTLFRKSDIAKILYLISAGRVELLNEDSMHTHNNNTTVPHRLSREKLCYDVHEYEHGSHDHDTTSTIKPTNHTTTTSTATNSNLVATTPNSMNVRLNHGPFPLYMKNFQAHADGGDTFFGQHNDNVFSEMIEPGQPVSPIPFFFGLRQTCSARTVSAQLCRTFNLERDRYKSLVKLYPNEEDNISHNLLDVDTEQFIYDDKSQYSKSCTSDANRSDGNLSKISFGNTDESDDRSEGSIGSRYSRPSGSGGDQDQHAIDSVHKAILKARSKKEKEAVGACCMAAAEGKLDELKHLLAQSRNTRISAGDYDRRTALHLAASNGHANIVRWLIDNGADISAYDRFNNTPLHDAMRHKHDSVIGILRDAGATLELNSAHAASLLCKAAFKGDKAEIMRLIDNHINPNVVDYDGRTALHLAAAEGNCDIVQFLLSRHANVNVRDRSGGTPLTDAIMSKRKDAQKLLKECGGIINHDDDAASELCRIASEGNLDKMRYFIENGMDINIGDYDSRRALHLGCCEGRLGMVEYLLTCHNIDVNVVDRFGGTPLEDAIREGHESIAIVLRRRGAVRSDNSCLDSRKQLLRTQAVKRRIIRQKEEAASDHDIELVSESCAMLHNVVTPLAQLNKQIQQMVKALFLNINNRTGRSKKAIEAAPPPDVTEVCSPIFLTAFRTFMKEEAHAGHILECYLACIAYKERPSYHGLEDLQTRFISKNGSHEVGVANKDADLVAEALARGYRNEISEPPRQLLHDLENELQIRLRSHIRNFRRSDVFRSEINSRAGRLWRILKLCGNTHSKAEEFQNKVLDPLFAVVDYNVVKKIFGDRSDHIENLIKALNEHKERIISLKKTVIDLALGQRLLYKRTLQHEAILHANSGALYHENSETKLLQNGSQSVLSKSDDLHLESKEDDSASVPTNSHSDNCAMTAMASLNKITKDQETNRRPSLTPDGIISNTQLRVSSKLSRRGSVNNSRKGSLPNSIRNSRDSISKHLTPPSSGRIPPVSELNASPDVLPYF